MASPVPNFAGVYMKAVLSHPHVAEWIDKAQDEPWVIEQYEVARPPRRAVDPVRRAVLVDVAAVGVNIMSMSE